MPLSRLAACPSAGRQAAQHDVQQGRADAIVVLLVPEVVAHVRTTQLAQAGYPASPAAAATVVYCVVHAVVHQVACNDAREQTQAHVLHRPRAGQALLSSRESSAAGDSTGRSCRGPHSSGSVQGALLRRMCTGECGVHSVSNTSTEDLTFRGIGKPHSWHAHASLYFLLRAQTS